MDFSSAIRSARTTLHMSQVDVARRAGITTAYLSQIECNKRPVGFVTLRSIAEGLGTTVEILIWQAMKLPDDLRPSDRRICEAARTIIVESLIRSYKEDAE